MTNPHDIHYDFAAWTAHNWAQLVPNADATAAAVAIRFIRTATELAKSHDAAIKPWKNQGITRIEDFRILGLLRHLDGQGISSQHIAEHLDFEPATVASRLKRLEQHGHITRIDHPSNRRTHHIILNPTSAPVVDDIYEALVNNHAKFFGAVSDTQHKQLANILKQLRI
jgi:DNA-binding MarR family transcriptional regulator